jgi:predicted hotdog family 3-hydroxylacyl-ACP dehydratase
MDRAAMAQLLPHGDGMCLLDELRSWDGDRLQCVSRCHRRSDNPLLTRGQLPCVCLVEVCAQAAALHGALSNATAGGAGLAYLGAVKQLELAAQWIDPGEQDLQISVSRVLGSDAGAVYQIAAGTPERGLLRGRIVLVVVA